MYVSLRSRPTASERPTTARRAVGTTVILLGLVSLTTDISSESVNAVLPVYLTSVLGLSPLAYGFVDGIYQGVSAVLRLLGGWVSDRTDHPKWVAATGYALSAGCRVFLLPTQALAGFVSIITVDRLGKGLRTAPRDAMIAASSDPADYGRAFGVHRTLDTVGALLGPLVAFAVLLALPLDYRSVFALSLAFAVVGVALLILIVPDVRPRRAARPAPVARPPRPARRIPADRRLIRLLVVAGLLGVLSVGDGFVYLQLADRNTLTASYFPLLYVGTDVAYLLLAVPLGRLADRIGRSRVLIGGHVALVLCYACAGGPWAGPVLAVATLLLLGTYYAATDGILAAISGQLVDTPVRTSAIASAQTVLAAARFAASLLFGWLWTVAGRQSAMQLFAIALAIAIPIAAWLLAGMRHRQPAPA